jgi:hypothetical protein
VNRTQAAARVDQLLAWKREEMVTGRCPACGVVGEPMGPVGGAFAGWQFTHTETCPLARGNWDIARLSQRYGFRLEDRVIPNAQGQPVAIVERVEVHR